jgi:hypothetical protein
LVEAIIMNKTIQATLLSTLVFPGAGQFLRKKYLLGGVLAGMAFISVCVIFVNIVERSLMIADKIQQGEIPLDVGTISALILDQQTTASSGAIVSVASIVLLSAWLTSIIESFITKS